MLTVYPTSLALRQAQSRGAAADGFFDGRGHVSVRMLMESCAVSARQAAILSMAPVTDLERDLAVVEASSRFHENAAGSGVLGSLSETAIEEVLVRLIAYIDPLADMADEFLALLTEDENPTDTELAALYRVYDEILQELGYASTARVNAAILQVLRGSRTDWPRIFLGVERVDFIGLRWVPPFVELTARALADKLGRKNVRLIHILEEHEQEWWGENLMSQTGTLVFGGEAARAEWSQFNAPETVASIGGFMDRLAHLDELREGYAMLDPALAAPARPHVGFSQSVGIYGEVEDLARRIGWLLETGKCRPADIAFCARNLGDYSDAVTNVFSRFGIPYYFRRGVPVMSLAVVKDMLNLVELAVSPRRDTFCSLLDSPWLNWQPILADDDEWLVHPTELADEIRRSGVEPEIKTEHVLVHRLEEWFSRDGPTLRRRKAQAAADVFKCARGNPAITSLADSVKDIRQRCDAFKIEDRLREWAEPSGDGQRDTAAYILNTRGFSAVMKVFNELEAIGQRAWHKDMTWYDTASVISRCISNLTVSDPGSASTGVWVVTPYDMAGLHFKAVLAAGLNSGMFPVMPRQSALFTDADLECFRDTLTEDRLPRAALAGSRARNSQENLLFLSMMAAAGECMVFSRYCRDESGRDMPASVFYSTLWRLAGWAGCGDELPALPPDAYDKWRLEQAPSLFADHWQAQATLPPHDRQPFHGESFLASVPAALCRATDEARQDAVLNPAGIESAGADETVATTVSRSLDIENARNRFFDRLTNEDDEEILPDRAEVVGEIGKELVQDFLTGNDEPVDFSTTALQDLANCPYKYYLSRVLGLDTLETNELEANPMDFGSAIHLVMETGFLLLLGEHARAETKFPGTRQLLADGILDDFALPSHIVPAGGTWKYIGKTTNPPADARPVVVLDPDKKEAYLAIFDRLCDAIRDHASSGNETWKLGPIEQADIQWGHIRASVCSLLEAQFALTDSDYTKMADGQKGDSYIRCTVFLEHVFDSRSHPRYNPDTPSVDYLDPDGTGDRLRVHGVIDRVDLLFDANESGMLKALLVLDYKGNSKKGKTSTQLAADIVGGHDCQLPVYGTAARRTFLSGDTPDIPIVCQYLIYKLESSENIKAMRNWWITLDGRPIKEEALNALCNGDLASAFARRLFKCLNTLREGLFTVRPDSCDYCDYKHVCRFAKPQLEKEDDR